MATAKKAAPKKAAAKKAAPKKAAAKKAAPKKAAVQRKNSSACYFTTACTEFYGLPDHCSQLMTLRQFRDGVLSRTKKGQALIKLYYKVAPSIVTSIKNKPNPAKEFALIFEHVNKACQLIWQKQYLAASNTYVKMVTYLMKKYL